MSAVFRHELRGYFHSLTAYVFGAFLLLVVGFGSMLYNLNAAVSNFEYVLSYSLLVFVVIVPVLTMRVLAEERRQRTDQLLYSLPITTVQVITGKYLALLTIFAVPTAVICLYPLLLAQHGTISYAMSYTSILGFFLLGAAYIAIGVFISSITESQVIAAVIAFIVLFITYVEEGIAGFFPESAEGSLFAFMVLAALFCLWIGSMIKNPVVTGVLTVVLEAALVIAYFVDSTLLEGKIQDFLAVFGLSGHLNNFIYGILDLNGIIYYLSVVVLCLFFTVQSLQKRRWN